MTWVYMFENITSKERAQLVSVNIEQRTTVVLTQRLYIVKNIYVSSHRVTTLRRLVWSIMSNTFVED